MLLAAKHFAEIHSKRLSVPNPAPHANSSRPGEYPRSRTGNLARSVAYTPTVPAKVAESLTVTIGYKPEAFYGGILENKMRRLGLRKTLMDVARQIAVFIQTKAKVF
jgi:hypothetical protein